MKDSNSSFEFSAPSHVLQPGQQIDYDYYLRRGRYLRSQAAHQLLAAATAGVAKLGRALVSAVARARRNRIALRELAGLGDYQLKDIGLTRGQVRAVIAGMASLDQIEQEREQALGQHRRRPQLTLPGGGGRRIEPAKPESKPDRSVADYDVAA